LTNIVPDKIKLTLQITSQISLVADLSGQCKQFNCFSLKSWRRINTWTS
jgi:hypothetical protein